MTTARVTVLPGYLSAAALTALSAPDEREDVRLGTYSFLPFVRSGIAAGLTTAFDWSLPSRGAVTVTLPVLDAAGGSHPVAQTLSVLGPGDVARLDPAQVVRTHPTAGDRNASSEDLVAVDLDRPDLPWMFTPAAPAPPLPTDPPALRGQHLVPWLSLVVIVDTGTALRPGSDGGLDRLVTTSDQLHPLEGAWAYAHAQLNGPPDHYSLAKWLSDRNAPLNCSRLMSPRRLDSNTDYVAAVVPTFLAGRQAGLGLEPVTTLAPAWHAGEGEVTLPVYYSWRFSTGDRGDFEDLAHQLVGVRAPYGVGYRTVDTSSPAPGLEEPDPDAGGREQVVAGPLVSPDATPGPGQEALPSEARQAWSAARTTDLAGRLGEGAPDDPRVAPPLYAGSHIARTTTDGAPDWFKDLNLVPRNRIVAGLGARVVQMDQEALMASAWQQVRGVDAANRALRLAQLARHLGESLHTRHLAELDTAALFGVTRAVHTKLLDAPERTLAATVRDSALPTSVASAAWRRFTRPTSRLARLPGADTAARSTILARLVADADGVGRDWRHEYAAPDGVVSVSDLALALVPEEVGARLAPDFAAQLRGGLAARPALPDVLMSGDPFGGADPAEVNGHLARELAPALLGRILAAAPDSAEHPDPAGLLVAASQAAVLAGALDVTSQVVDRVSLPTEVAKRLRLDPADPPDGDTVQVRIDDVRGYLERLRAAANEAGLSDELGTHFAQAEQLRGVLDRAFDTGRLSEGLGRIGETLMPVGGLVDRDREPLRVSRDRLLADLHPRVTVTARIVGRLTAASGALPPWVRPDWFAGGGVEPIMAAPHFRIPMALRLYAYDPEWLMPGIAKIEPHQAVTLLQTNNTFVESFLVGLNTEMANELLWRGYPTDRRGTYFSSFWRRVDDLATEVHRFSDGALGSHVDAALDGKIVLFVRGDLVRRFPGLVAHAMTEFDKDANGVPSFNKLTLRTFFQVPLAPDVLLVGFDVTAASVAAGAPDVWFTLSENPTEPRFGLDLPRDDVPAGPRQRNDLSWADATLDGGRFLTPGSWIESHLAADLVHRDAAEFAHLVFQLPSRAAYLGHNLLDRFGALDG